MDHRFHRLGLLGIGAFLFGCGAGAEPGAELLADGEGETGTAAAAALTNCASKALGSPINDHACTHVTLGPFGGVQARTTVPFQSFSGIHRYFTVTFQDVTAPYVGKVKFTPANTDDHVIYFDPSNVSVSVALGATPIAPDAAISPNPGSTTCTGLSRYSVFPLVAGSTYDITITSPTASTARVELEEVAPYRVKWYQDADGDTWGLTSSAYQTACVPPAGYTVLRGSDCNDGNASVFPGATEVCGDGVDSNCNGNDCT